MRYLSLNAVRAFSVLICAAMLTTAVNAQEGVMIRPTPEGNATAVCGHFAYVTNSYSDTLSVIDISENRLVANHPTGVQPVNPTFNRDWTKLYFANVEDGTLSIVDTKSGEIEKTISADAPTGAPHPSGLRFLPDGRHLAISFMGDKLTDVGALGVMDLETGKLVKKVPVQARPERFDITPDGKRAYVANLLSQTVSVVDLEKNTVIATIPSPKYPFNVLVSPKGHRAFVGTTMGHSIIEIDTATNKVVKTIKTAAGPNGMTFTPDGDNILMTNVYAGRMQVYNLSAGVVSDGSFVGFFPGFIRLTPDGQKGIFVRPYGRKISIFDGTTLQIVENIETGIGPSTVAICGNP